MNNNNVNTQNGVDKKILERYEIADILAANFQINGEYYNACDFEWPAYQLQEAGYEKRHTGQWVKPSPLSEYICSECKKSPKKIFEALPPYCPNCGSIMKAWLVRPKDEVAREIIGTILANHTPDVDGFIMVHQSELIAIPKQYEPKESEKQNE